MTERLPYIDTALYKRVQRVLGINLSERHLRGGNATRLKYAQKRMRNSLADSQILPEKEKRKI